MNSELTVQNNTLNFSDKEMIATLKATVAQGLSDQEFFLFAEFCKSTGLNPIKKEIWAIKTGGRLQLMTGINGFFSIANGHKEYDGIESGLIDPAGDYKPLTYPKPDFIGAWSRVHRKDRKIPVEAVAMMSEYKKSGPTWQSMPRVMILKCAESVALRKAFPQELNGMYTQEEMPVDYSPKEINVTPTPQAPKVIKQWYLVPEVTADQEYFLNTAGCTQLKNTDYWAAPKNLGPKLKKFESESPLLDGEKFDPSTGEILESKEGLNDDKPAWL